MAAPDIVDLLGEAVAGGASDLHLSTDCPAMARINGVIRPLAHPPLSAEDCREMVMGVLTDSQRVRLEEEWELDFAVHIEGIGRFRGNAHYNRGALEAAFRYIPSAIPEISQLGHRPTIFQICDHLGGLVLVTGATGSGKSTTVASMVKHISEKRAGMIVTVEDPIEYLIPNALSIVKQREVGTDTHSFAHAVRNALRQDPDVIVVGEMRDPETIGAAITAAETGHLVLGTLHTMDAPKAIDRIVDVFPPDQQGQIIAQLANALVAVVCQHLIPRDDGKGRVLATEMLVANAAVRACVRERRWEQLVGLIEIGSKDGMHTLDDSLEDLYMQRIISKETAVATSRDQKRFLEITRLPPATRSR